MTARQKKLLIFNAVVVLLSVAALVVALLGWFTNAAVTAKLEDIDLVSDGINYEIEAQEHGKLVFPCATDLSDTAITPALFNTEDAVLRHYKITNNGDEEINMKVSFANKVKDNVEMGNVGLQYLVCPDAQDTDYFAMIAAACSDLGPQGASWTYDAMKEKIALYNNAQTITVPAHSTLTAAILFWVDYRLVNTGIYPAEYTRTTMDLLSDYGVVVTFSAF